MRCARLSAPFVTALCIFDTRRGGSAARRSRRMVSSRAYSSPSPQPASRHSIKPFSIEPIIANIRCPAGFRSQDVRRRRDECQIRHSAVLTSQYGWRFGDGCSSNVHSLFCRRGSRDLNSALLRMLSMMMRITYRTRVQLEGYGKAHSGISCASCPPTPSPRAGRLFAACRAMVLCDGRRKKRKWRE